MKEEVDEYGKRHQEQRIAGTKLSAHFRSTSTLPNHQEGECDLLSHALRIAK